MPNKRRIRRLSADLSHNSYERLDHEMLNAQRDRLGVSDFGPSNRKERRLLLRELRPMGFSDPESELDRIIRERLS